MDRETLLALDRAIAEGRQVEFTAPDVVVTDRFNNLVGVGVDGLEVELESACVTAAEVAESGLTPAEVPNIRIIE